MKFLTQNQVAKRYYTNLRLYHALVKLSVDLTSELRIKSLHPKNEFQITLSDNLEASFSSAASTLNLQYFSPDGPAVFLSTVANGVPDDILKSSLPAFQVIYWDHFDSRGRRFQSVKAYLIWWISEAAATLRENFMPITPTNHGHKLVTLAAPHNGYFHLRVCHDSEKSTTDTSNRSDMH